MRIFMGIKEIKRLLHLASEHPRDHALFHLAFSTGLRVSDLLKLRRSELMEKSGQVVSVLHVRMKKTKKWIDRPLRKDCRQTVAMYLALREDDNIWLFASESNHSTGKAMTRQSAHRIYKQYLGMIYPESMLVGASTHSLRRSAAKLISLKSGRAECAQSYLGHASLTSTYAYIDMNDFEKKANSVVISLNI